MAEKKDLGNVIGPKGKKGDDGAPGAFGYSIIPVTSSITSPSQIPTAKNGDYILNATSVPLTIGNLNPVVAGELCLIEDKNTLQFSTAGNIRGPTPITMSAPDYSKPPTNIDGPSSGTSGTFTMPFDGFASLRVNGTINEPIEIFINNIRVQYEYAEPHIITYLGPVKKDSVIRWARGTSTTLSQLICYPPTVIELGGNIPLHRVNSLLTMGPPDYPHKENINRFPTVPATWTVEQDGYIYFSCYPQGVSGNNNLYINGGTALVVDGPAGDSQFKNGIFAVKKGDVVFLPTPTSGTYSYISLQFIPPVLNPPQYIEARPTIDYAYIEQPTGIRFVNGKMIYQKTIINTAGASIAQSANYPLGNISTLLPGITQIVKSEYVYDTRYIINTFSLILDFVNDTLLFRNDQPQTSGWSEGVKKYFTIFYTK